MEEPRNDEQYDQNEGNADENEAASEVETPSSNRITSETSEEMNNKQKSPDSKTGTIKMQELDEKDPLVKKMKLEEPAKQKDKAENSVKENTEETPELKVEAKKCELCHQILNDSNLKLYQGHPDNAVEESVALADPKLSLFTGKEDDVNEYDARPQNKITYFTIYDENGHLCPIDAGLIERDVLLYFSGHLKAVYEEDGSTEGGIPTKDLGPIDQWWICGYDGGETALLGLSTPYADYYLLEPSPDYAPFMESVKEKMYLAKLVIDFLLDEENPSFEDLIKKMQTTVPPPGVPKLTEESLLKHAKFVCDQVLSYEAASDDNEKSFITTACMRSLAQSAGITFGKRRATRRIKKKIFKKKKPASFKPASKATTTLLDKTDSETFFTGQSEATDDTDKVGNAVPPPLGAALEYRKAFPPPLGAASEYRRALPPPLGAASEYRRAFLPPLGAALESRKVFPPPLGAASEYRRAFSPPLGAALESRRPIPLPLGAALESRRAIPLPFGAALESRRTVPPPLGAASEYRRAFLPPLGAALESRKVFPPPLGAASEYRRAFSPPLGAALESRRPIPLPLGAALESRRAIPLPFGAALESRRTVPPPLGAALKSRRPIPLPLGAALESRRAIPLPFGAALESRRTVPLPLGEELSEQDEKMV